MKTSKHTCLTLRIALTILGAVLTYFLWQREGSLPRDGVLVGLAKSWHLAPHSRDAPPCPVVLPLVSLRPASDPGASRQFLVVSFSLRHPALSRSWHLRRGERALS